MFPIKIPKDLRSERNNKQNMYHKNDHRTKTDTHLFLIRGLVSSNSNFFSLTFQLIKRKFDSFYLETLKGYLCYLFQKGWSIVLDRLVTLRCLTLNALEADDKITFADDKVTSTKFHKILHTENLRNREQPL